jgi:hypothetical protein
MANPKFLKYGAWVRVLALHYFLRVGAGRAAGPEPRVSARRVKS